MVKIMACVKIQTRTHESFCELNSELERTNTTIHTHRRYCGLYYALRFVALLMNPNATTCQMLLYYTIVIWRYVGHEGRCSVT